MNSPQIKSFIRQQSALFWYIPDDKKENISPELLVETIFNYGDMDAVKQLITLLGVKKTEKIFQTILNTSERKKGNLHELTIHFFKAFFNRYANPRSESRTG